MTCQQCGAENPGANRFCIKCGAELGAGTAGPEPTPPTGGYVSSPGTPISPPGFGGAGAGGIVWPHDQLVGFGPRFVAAFIDMVVLAIAYKVLDAIHLGAIDSLAGTAYLVYFWSTTGQTLGNIVMKIKVARADGQALSISTGVLRYVGYVISIIAIFIGVLWVLWDPNKQGWHDKIASTVVVRAP